MCVRERETETGDLRCVYVLLYVVACLFNVCVCVLCVDAIGPPALLCIAPKPFCGETTKGFSS